MIFLKCVGATKSVPDSGIIDAIPTLTYVSQRAKNKLLVYPKANNSPSIASSNDPAIDRHIGQRSSAHLCSIIAFGTPSPRAGLPILLTFKAHRRILSILGQAHATSSDDPVYWRQFVRTFIRTLVPTHIYARFIIDATETCLRLEPWKVPWERSALTSLALGCSGRGLLFNALLLPNLCGDCGFSRKCVTWNPPFLGTSNWLSNRSIVWCVVRTSRSRAAIKFCNELN